MSNYDILSFISRKINLRRGNIFLSSATAFTIEYKSELYLITNWHVLSGRSRYTGQPINASGALPDNITLFLPMKGNVLTFCKRGINLVDSEGNYSFLQHKRYGQDVDIAVLPISAGSEDDIEIAAYYRHIEDSDLKIEVGYDVYIIGYPDNLSVTEPFPVWKRASIASEPAALISNMPSFLIDSLTRLGMSGSPVYRRTWNHANFRSGGIAMGPGTYTELLGVYSGRFGALERDSMYLGQVWDKTLIAEIIDDPSPASFELRS